MSFLNLKQILILALLATLASTEAFSLDVSAKYQPGTCLGFYRHTYKGQPDGSPADLSSFLEIVKIIEIKDNDYIYEQIFQHQSPDLSGKLFVGKVQAERVVFEKRRSYLFDCSYFDSMATKNFNQQ